MSSFKIVNQDYTLTCNNGNGIFTVNAQTVFEGNVTYTVPAVTTSPFITVAANNTGSISDMGMLAQLSSTSFAGLRFDAIANTWQISSSVASNGAPISAYVNIATGNTTVAGSNTQIQYNGGQNLAASANLTFDYANNVLTLSGVEALTNVGNAVPANIVASTTLMFSNPVSGGGTGLYFVSPTAAGELVSKSKAIVYSLIF
jgi:hypothetical protein